MNGARPALPLRLQPSLGAEPAADSPQDGGPHDPVPDPESLLAAARADFSCRRLCGGARARFQGARDLASVPLSVTASCDWFRGRALLRGLTLDSIIAHMNLLVLQFVAIALLNLHQQIVDGQGQVQ